jgi:hypothetical protein
VVVAEVDLTRKEGAPRLALDRLQPARPPLTRSKRAA